MAKQGKAWVVVTKRGSPWWESLAHTRTESLKAFYRITWLTREEIRRAGYKVRTVRSDGQESEEVAMKMPEGVDIVKVWPTGDYFAWDGSPVAKEDVRGRFYTDAQVEEISKALDRDVTDEMACRACESIWPTRGGCITPPETCDQKIEWKAALTAALKEG